MGLFFSPFRWLFVILGIVFLGIAAIVIASTIFVGVALGHALIFGPHYFPFFGFGFVLLGILAFALISGLFFRPYRRRMYYGGGWYRNDSAMESLRQRYARGEITRDQFEQMASDLERHH